MYVCRQSRTPLAFGLRNTRNWLGLITRPQENPEVTFLKFNINAFSTVNTIHICSHGMVTIVESATRTTLNNLKD